MYEVVLHSDLARLEPYIDAAILERLKNGQVERFESFGNVCPLSFDWHNHAAKAAKAPRLIIFFSADRLFFICDKPVLAEKVSSLIRDFPENDKVLYSFFSDLMKPDTEYLDNLEERISELESNLLENFKPEYTHQIILFRKEILRLKKYYDQLGIIFDNLTQNENGLICSTHLRYFVVLSNRVDRLRSTVQNLRDFVSQVREAYQAQIDIEQNGIMKIFTVITAVFLPLTLIVGWFGMNLQMPEFSWSFGYPAVIILSVVVCISCIAIFKVKKWF